MDSGSFHSIRLYFRVQHSCIQRAVGASYSDLDKALDAAAIPIFFRACCRYRERPADCVCSANFSKCYLDNGAKLDFLADAGGTVGHRDGADADLSIPPESL